MEIQIKHFRIDGYRCSYFLEYYPKKLDNEIPSEQFDLVKEMRGIVYNFKDGYNGREIAQVLEYFTSDIIGNDEPKDWWICVIPASSPYATNRRFSEFCSYFCQKSGVNNGYSMITIDSERQKGHLINRFEIDPLDGIQMNNISRKKIILFDDVTTSGRSFKKIADKLIELGADEIRGVFLSKTTYLQTYEQRAYYHH